MKVLEAEGFLPVAIIGHRKAEHVLSENERLCIAVAYTDYETRVKLPPA